MKFDFVNRHLLRARISLAKRIYGKEHPVVQELWEKYTYKTISLTQHINRLEMEQEIQRRARFISLFDYQALSLPFKFAHQYHFSISDNDVYGIGYALSRYLDFNQTTMIEHGVYFGEYVSAKTFESSVENIITASEYRKQALKKQVDKPIEVVGTYMNYAHNLFNDFKFNQIKAKLGKTLLVFPSHSISTVHAQFDISEFIGFIENIKEKGQFDSVLVCLYFKDIELGHAAIYEKQGYRIVTAGFNLDYYFLDRLKTLILLSDYTVSNDLGTHIGYCVQLGKPHQVYQSHIDFVAGEDKEGAKIELNLRNEAETQLRLKEKNDICMLFAEYSEQISLQQQKCVDYYFGEKRAIL